MLSKRVEVGVVSLALLGLGLVCYYLLPAPSQGRRKPAPTSDVPVSAPGPTVATALSRPELGAISAAILRGVVRDYVRGGAVADVTLSFTSQSGMAVMATSSSEGMYEVRLAPGRYQVRAVGSGVAVAGDADLAIPPGARSQTMDIAVVLLARVSGRVVDGSGEPVPRARIAYRGVTLPSGAESASAVDRDSVEAGTDGSFEVQVLPGEVVLIARAEGRPDADTTIRWVEPGAAVTGIEIVMEAGGAVSGRVVSASGAPAPGAQVTAYDPSGRPLATVSADRDGAFALSALPAGSIALVAVAQGLGPSPPLAVAIEEGSTRQGLVLTLGEGRTITGKVVDTKEAPIAQATVTATPIGAPGEPETGRSGADGSFALAGLGTGMYLVTASADGYASTTLPAAPAAGASSTRPSASLVIVLARTGGLAGVVTGEGRVVRDITVQLRARGTALPATGTGMPNGDGDDELRPIRIGSPDGTYAIDGLRPGRYDVVFAAPGLAPEEIANIEIVPGERTQLSADLSPGATVYGKVTDAKTGMAIRGAAVYVTTGSAAPMGFTDDLGIYAITEIAPGRRTIEVRHPGYTGKLETGVELTAGDRRAVDMALMPLPFGKGETIEFAGIGAALAVEASRLVVQNVLPHGPAEIAGLMPGDEITHINGVLTRDRSFADCIEMLRGVAGTVVRLYIRRGSQDLVRDILRANVRYKPAE